MDTAQLAPGPAAIAVALAWEATPFVKHLGLSRYAVHEGVAQYRRGDSRVLLLQAGMGRGGATRAFARLGKPAFLLSAGFCGGVGSAIGLGDMVVASQVIGPVGSFPADPFLLETATRALKTIDLPFHVGTMLTVDEVLMPGEKIPGQANQPILAVDMESAFLADTARQQGIPFLAIRVASDTPAVPWAAHGKLFVDRDGRLKPGVLAATLLRHPSWIPRMLHLAYELRLATGRLAQGIKALLKEIQA